MLFERDARYGNRVKVASAIARQQGVRPAMPLSEAQSLTTTADGSAADGSSRNACHFADYYPEQDRAALKELAEWCERFSPVVGLDAEQQPDGLLLDASVARLFGGEAAWSRAIVSGVTKQGFTSRVVIADTIGAAWGMLRWQPAGVQQAIERAAPNLPVELLRLQERTVQQLRRLGIHDLKTLQGMARAGLAARFGKSLLERLDQFSGAVPEVIVAHRPRPPLAVARELEHATGRREIIRLICEELLQALSRRLVEQGQGVLGFCCQLDCQAHPPLIMHVGLYQPAVDPRHLGALLQMQLEQQRLPAAVEAVRIAATTTAPRGGRQAELFAGATRGRESELGTLIERLSNRLGRQRVVRAEFQAQAQVELAYRWAPLTGERSSPRSRDAEPPTQLGPLLRPLHVLDPPQPIDVIAVALSGPPAQFAYRRRRYRVSRHFGPERIETGWWRGPSCRRDYYRVETDGGHRWWLFRDLQQQRWFLHGVFD